MLSKRPNGRSTLVVQFRIVVWLVGYTHSLDWDGEQLLPKTECIHFAIHYHADEFITQQLVELYYFLHEHAHTGEVDNIYVDIVKC